VNKLKNSPDSIDQYDRYEVDNSFFEKFDIESIDIATLLFQTGYLTIKEITGHIYILSYPNREVRIAFFQNILEGFSSKSQNERNKLTRVIKQALYENKIADFIQSIKILLSSIPYSIHIENREAYYHSIIYIALQLSMMDVQAEIQTALGRSDIVVSLDRFVYIIEFKMSSAQIALEQIEEKQYYTPYLGTDKTIVLLGIGLDKIQRNIGDWKTKEVGSETSTNIPAETQTEKPAPIEASKNEEKLSMAKQMLTDNLPIELIVKYSGLSAEEIKGL